MSKKSMIEMGKKAAIDAQYRVATEQIGKGSQQGIMRLVQAGNFSSDQMKQIEKFLGSDLGLALLKFSMGMAIHNMPEEISSDARAARLAEEFTTDGMALAANTAIGSLVGEILPLLSGAIDSLPTPAPAARIAEVTANDVVSESSDKAKGRV